MNDRASRKTPPLLWRSSWRFLISQPWLFGLSILGVALGVAVVVSVDVTNESAKRGFELSAEAVMGRSTHYISGTGNKLDEKVYRDLRIKHGFRKSAPVVEGIVTHVQSGRTLQLMGIDPIVEGEFRSYTSTASGIELSEFITGKRTTLLTDQLAEELNVRAGEWLEIRISGKRDSLYIGDLIEAADDRSQLALNNLLVADISTAQQIFGMNKSLSRIDLNLTSGEHQHLEKLSSILPEGVVISRSERRSEMLTQMIKAFDTNLQALSMLALLVGLFLIYNTMTFSVIYRRPLIGRLRAAGVLQKEILKLILFEALLIGLIGTLVGLAGGLIMAQLLLSSVTQTINDLYFTVSVREITFVTSNVLKALGLGIAGTLLVVLWPARKAAYTPLHQILRRSFIESSLTERFPKLRLAALLIMSLGGLILLIEDSYIVTGYLSLLCLIIGFSLLLPELINLMVHLMVPVVRKASGIIGVMSLRGVSSELSRTSVAISALIVAVAATVGVGMMVDSFRFTVESWLETQLEADIYVQLPGGLTQQSDASLDPQLIELLRMAPGITSSRTVRRQDVESQFGLDRLVVLDPQEGASPSTRLKKQAPEFWDRFSREAAVKVSEAYAYRHKVDVGDTILMMTDRGRQEFEILAIYYDYSTDKGLIGMDRSVYNQFFIDRSVSGLALFVDPDYHLDDVISNLRSRSQDIQNVIIQSNRGLREASMDIFDRTFRVTMVLRLLAILVAFIGILSALMALQLERSQQMAVLRAGGMSPIQLWFYMISQTSFVGLFAGVLAIPLGMIMAVILVYVINLRSFGWTMEFQLMPDVLFQALLLALVASILAGIYPAWKMSRTNPSKALRYE